MTRLEMFVFSLFLLLAVPTCTVLYVRWRARGINARYHASMATIHAEGARVVAEWERQDAR